MEGAEAWLSDLTLQSPTPELAPTETLFKAAPIVWCYLQPAERTAVRTSCREGQLLCDRLLQDLRLRLLTYQPRPEAVDAVPSHLADDSGPVLAQRPTTEQISTCLAAVIARGAQLRSLVLRFEGSHDAGSQAQLLAVLEACRACPSLTCLRLEGNVPMSGATALAVEACLPHLDSLCLSNTGDYIRASPPAGQRRFDAAEYDAGCVQLLTLCGPRLRELQLLGGCNRWAAVSWMAVQSCTALTRLELEAGWRDPEDEDAPGTCNIDNQDDEAHILSIVAQLTSLQSLSLHTNVKLGMRVAEMVPSYDDLSTLTALTSLRLLLSGSYDYTGGLERDREEAAGQFTAWTQVRAAHRAEVFSALRAMPQLQHLHCPTLWLLPAEAASLTALTSLTLGGMLPPSTNHPPPELEGSEGPGPAAPTATSAVPLPPQLQELVLLVGASPRLLARLQPPASLLHLSIKTMTFGISDLPSDGRVVAEAVEAVGPAVQLLVDLHGRSKQPHHYQRQQQQRQQREQPTSMCIRGGGWPDCMRPPEGSLAGHAEWIRQLRGLDVYDRVELSALALETGDLCCLGQALPNLQHLYLLQCTFPVAALPALRCGMPQLRTLQVDFDSIPGPVAREVLEPVMVLLCRPHPAAHAGWGAPPLQRLTLEDCAQLLDDPAGCRTSVLQQLEHVYGVTSTDVRIL